MSRSSAPEVDHAPQMITHRIQVESPPCEAVGRSAGAVSYAFCSAGRAEFVDMVRYRYKAWNEGEGDAPRHFAIHVEVAEDRWVSNCHEIDEDGTNLPEATAMAPQFYGVTAEQAHRRMRDVLENTYDRVEAVAGRVED